MANKSDRTVVRNMPYRREGVGIRERHNERKNEAYSNPDVMPEYSHLNVHFKKCEGTYADVFDKLCDSGVISTRGLKKAAKVFEKMVFDVNTAYFDKHGGYELRCVQIGGRRSRRRTSISSPPSCTPTSATGTCPKNWAGMFSIIIFMSYTFPLSKRKILWTKRRKDKPLVGAVKETVTQVSYSKKWSSERAADETGNPVLNANGRRLSAPTAGCRTDFSST